MVLEDLVPLSKFSFLFFFMYSAMSYKVAFTFLVLIFFKEKKNLTPKPDC